MAGTAIEDFKGKDQGFVSEWLMKEGFKESVVESFEKNEIDGNSFVLLTENMMKELVPMIGPLSKLVAKHKALFQKKKELTEVCNAEIDSQEINCNTSQNNVSCELSHTNCVDIGDEAFEPDELQLQSTPKRFKQETEPLEFAINFDKYTRTLPDPFTFPHNFSPLVAAALSSTVMTPHTVEKFITEVARAAFAFKCYPQPDEFTRLSLQCIEKYPFLKSSQGGHGHIEAGLKRRYKEFRRTPKQMTRAVKKEKTDSLDIDVELEDDVSFARNVSVLQAESRKTKPNMSSVQQLMEVTFSRRGKEIEKGQHIKEILEKFPSLTIHEQLIEEAARILKINDLRKIVNTKWSNLKDKIIQLAKGENKSSVRNILSKMDDSTVEDCESIYALVLLINRQKLDTECVISFIPNSLDVQRIAESLAPTPTILCCLEINKSILVVDRIIVTDFPIIDSVLMLLSAFYIFHVEYPKGFVRFYTLLEILLFNIKPLKADAKVDTILSCLS